MAVLATIAYVFENRGGGANTRPLLRLATALVVGHAMFIAYGSTGLYGFCLVESIMMLSSGRDFHTSQGRVVIDDSAFIAHSIIVAYALRTKPWHLFLAAAWSFADAMDLRFSGRRGGGALHLSIVALYVYRDADVRVVYVLWILDGPGVLWIQRTTGYHYNQKRSRR